MPLVLLGRKPKVAERCIGPGTPWDETVRREDHAMAVVEPTFWMPLPNPPSSFDPH